MKFRIVEIIGNVGDSKRKDGNFSIKYVIEKKNFWGTWIEITRKEITRESIPYNTYEEAETYLYNKYMGHGECRHIGNEYEYTPYSYNSI